jgi:hypothetical protein
MMITSLILTQILLPLALILWLLLAPLRNSLGVSLQILVTAIGLLAIARMGVWIFPPWWTIYLYGLLFILALVTVLRRVKSLRKLPSQWFGWIVIIVVVAFGVFTSNEAVQSWTGQFPPPIPTVDLAFPLRNGNYLIVNGGSNIRINAHLKLLDKSVPRFQAYRGSAYGVDIIKIDPIGLRANGLLPSNPAAYRIYGEPVLAPCSGKIIKAVDGLPNMTIPQIDAVNRAGNHVILRCGNIDVLLAHFRPQSLSVRTGTVVQVGDRIAEAGNSGTSDEPHLHIHAQRFGIDDKPFSGDPLPMKFEGRFLVRGDRITSSIDTFGKT